MISQEILQKNY